MKNPTIFEGWIAKFGAEKIILGADFYPDAGGGKIATNGWQEESELSLIPFIQSYQTKGIHYVICTDISKDGMLQGPSFEIYSKILSETTNLKLIASGGISTFDEIPKLAAIGCEGVIIGKAIYENKISLKQLEQFISSYKV
jgi:phosphoribosylformimino-5-aminoimidazole carboxamide ribotide isomerase